MALKFSMILEAIDRASAPSRRAGSAIARLTAGVRRWGQDVRRVSRDITSGSRSLEHYERRARRLRQVALGLFFRAAREQARRFAESLRAGIRNLDLLGRAGRGAKAGLRWMGSKALGIAGGAAKWATAGAGALASFSLFDMFKTAGQFEQYQVMLEGTEGSAAKARKAMAWVQKFAQDTPFELDQVMGAFVQLKAYGIDPMDGSLATLGDAAAGMSKDIMEGVEALSDAMTGEYDRLKAFGITASVAGKNVTLTYRKNGKEIIRTVKASGLEMKQALTSIFADRFAGGAARQSKTMFGIINNLKDSWNGFLLMVARAGIFDRVKEGLDRLLANIAVMSQDGRLQKWAAKISEYLEKAWNWGVKFVEQTDWQRVGRDLNDIASAGMAVARAIAAMGDAYNKYKWVADLNPMTGGLLGNWLRGSKNDADSASPPQSAARGPAGRPRIAPIAPSGGRRLPVPAGERRPMGGSATRVGGAVDVNVRVQGPATATVARVATNNRAVPINAKVGKAMGGPA